jgi:hypothetical protein
LKTFNLPKHYPVVKVRAFQPGKTLSSPASSDPLVGGSVPTDQGSDVGVDTKQELDLAERLSPALALELRGAVRPDIHLLQVP